ncbi:MAG: ROK family protein [Clostridiales bacterium]|nr:ROK family protein [Clostridiales bacterium]
MDIEIPAGSPAMLTDLKIANRKSVLSAFRQGVQKNAGEISQETGISRPTVVKCIRFFREKGLLVSQGKGASTATGGKRPENYALSGKRYFLCIALWPMEMRACLYTLGHAMLGKISLPMPLPDTPEETGRQAAALAARLLREQCVLPQDVCAASVSTSGTVDRATNTLMFSSHTPGWGTRVHLLDDLSVLLGTETPIFLENAGKMCARPFLVDPALREQRLLVLFTTWGVSGTFIERGHITNGRRSLIGEIGHMTVKPDDPELCGCGSRGCFERLISPERMRRMMKEELALSPSDALSARLSDLSIPELFRQSEAGVPAACAVSERLARVFAPVLRNVSLAFDPDTVVLQGDYAAADSRFREELRRAMEGFHYFADGIPFRLLADSRDLSEMDAEGAFFALDHIYFSNPDLYRDEGPESV